MVWRHDYCVMHTCRTLVPNSVQLLILSKLGSRISPGRLPVVGHSWDTDGEICGNLEAL